MTGLWYAKLAISSIDMQLLQPPLAAAGYIVEEIDGTPYLALPASIEADAFLHARERSRSDLAVIAGLAGVYFDDMDPIRYAGLLYLDEHGQKRVPLEAEPVRAKSRLSGIPTVIGPDGQEVPQPPSDLASWLQAAASDDRVRRIARLCAYPPDWFTLYKVYEEIRAAVGGEAALWQLEGVSQQRVKHFTQTANSYDAIGDAARHSGAADYRPPKQGPMALDDAVFLLRSLLRLWLHKTIT